MTKLPRIQAVRNDGSLERPNDQEAERALLAGLLVYPERMDEAVAILRGAEQDFYGDVHRRIFVALLELWRAGLPIDFVTTTDRLRQMGSMDDLEELGGVAYLSTLTSAAMPPDRITPYAEIVRSLAVRREDVQLAEFLAEAAYHCESDEAYAIMRRSMGDALTLSGEDGDAEALPILADDEAEALPPLRGILGDILFDESVSYLYGPSGRWKSFLALDWSLCIATETPWMGRPVQGGDVLYVCSEGARGLGKRITAWKQRHGVRGRTRLRVLPLALDLTNASQVAALPRRLEALDIAPTLIVFDTLAASNSGDENTAENAARITAAARRIIRAHPGACVLIVHHTGYDNTHMRGSTAFYSNADTVIRIEGGDANRRIEPGEPITLVSDKPKEGEPFQDIIFTTERQTWADESGAIHASLVIVPGDESVARAKTKLDTLSPKRRAALAVIEAAPEDGLSWTAWLNATGMSRSSFYEMVSDFVRAKLVDINAAGNYYRLFASSVSSVRFVSGSDEPAKRSSVRFGVSIDTEQPNLAEPPAADQMTEHGAEQTIDAGQ